MLDIIINIACSLVLFSLCPIALCIIFDVNKPSFIGWYWVGLKATFAISLIVGAILTICFSLHRFGLL